MHEQEVHSPFKSPATWYAAVESAMTGSVGSGFLQFGHNFDSFLSVFTLFSACAGRCCSLETTSWEAC